MINIIIPAYYRMRPSIPRVRVVGGVTEYVVKYKTTDYITSIYIIKKKTFYFQWKSQPRMTSFSLHTKVSCDRKRLSASSLFGHQEDVLLNQVECQLPLWKATVPVLKPRPPT